MTLGIDQDEIKDFHNYGYLDQTVEDPEFRGESNQQNTEEGMGSIPDELCNQEPLINYYDKHRFKSKYHIRSIVQKFFKKISDQHNLDETEQRIFTELREY